VTFVLVLQAITLLWTLLNQNPHGKKGVVQKVIVVCPATLVQNWSKEIIKWLGSHRCKPIVLSGAMNTQEQQGLVQDFLHGLVNNVLIIGYEMFRKVSRVVSRQRESGFRSR
jgi:SNF2 family DNA or RNA helicase